MRRARLALSAGLERVVIGISGGLDSTHALLVCAQAMDRLKLPRRNILAYTMPGFATSEHTKGNSWKLMNALGVTAKEIDITPSSKQMLKDLEPGITDDSYIGESCIIEAGLVALEDLPRERQIELVRGGVDSRVHEAPARLRSAASKVRDVYGDTAIAAEIERAAGLFERHTCV